MALSKTKKQHAALPYVVDEGQVRVLLLTSRETRRWIIPKGWPKKKMAPHELAALEAYEEAGIKGAVDSEPLGVYHYVKRLDGDRPILCRVDVYPLLVTEQLEDWPEKGQRVHQWVRPSRAARMVNEKELGWLIRSFAPSGSNRSASGGIGVLMRRMRRRLRVRLRIKK